MNGEVTVREAMTPEFVGVSEGDDIVDAAELLLAEDVPGAVVLRGNEPVGMLTGRDVLQWLVDSDDGAEATVREGMRDGVPSISANRSVDDAAAEMFARSTSQLLVVDEEGDLQGVLTKGDIVAATTLGPTEQAPAVDSVQHEAERTTVVHENLEATAAGSAGDGGFSEQGICERCGALAAELTTTNGELLCSDCRDV
jgi:CBS domain-containing protein